MSEAKYIEIANEIKRLIDIGHYEENSKLPTHRALSNRFNTTPVTIAKAYKLLTDNGHIESFVGRGSFVKERPQLQHVIQSQLNNIDWNFSILQPCYVEHLDHLQHTLQQSVANVSTSHLYGYMEETGFKHHRQACMSWGVYYGLQARTADQIVLTNGAQHALFTLIELYSNMGDTVAVEAQTYPGILSIVRQLGRKAVAVKMDADGMCPNDLLNVYEQHKPSIVIVLPSHQNPTCVTMPLVRRKAIAKVLQPLSTWLIEDDIYGFLNPDPIAAISNFLPEKSFYINGLSKAISPGIRCGFIKSPQSQVARLIDFIRSSIWLVSPIMFEFASKLIESGDAFKLAEKQKKIALRRQVIAREILSDFEFQAQATSFHIWLTLPSSWQADEFVIAAKERGMLVSGSSFFNAVETHEQCVRLSLMAIVNDDHLTHGLQHLRDLLNRQSAHD